MKSRMRNGLFLLVMAIVLPVSQAVHAADPGLLVKQMPRSYSGQFQWRDSVKVYKVSMNFTDVRVLDTGMVEATGTGVYDLYGEITRVNVRAVIDPNELFLEIWEHESGAEPDGAEAEGLYRGDLSDDMRSITAMWTNFTNKDRGYLKLTATP